MELKLGRPETTNQRTSGSNRTFMELKFQREIQREIQSSNRTFMELK